MIRRGRDGELVEVDDPPEPTPRPRAHACAGGWIGEDREGRPVPCRTCKPHLDRLAANLQEVLR